MSVVIDKFLRYVQMDTMSIEREDEVIPSTESQRDLALLLKQELMKMGATEVDYDEEHCYVYATIPATTECENTIGFIAHMDTSPAVSGANVKPRIIKDYDGKDIVLNEEKHIIMEVKEFPELSMYQGKQLIVTDGNTLLGADDKAGVAEIMAMAEYLCQHKEIPHGKIRVGFTPDEEVGHGADYFDVKKFGANFAYTVDGGALGELEYENFNAAGAKLIIKGRSVHPGDAKNKMVNAILLAQEFQSMLPVHENPMSTEGYEGFYHPDTISGSVEEVTVEYIIRDHSKEKFEQKKERFLKIAEYLNDKYGVGTFQVMMKDSYYNMKEVILPYFHLIENAKKAMEEIGITPIVTPIRGGTDGARLSFMGLPCPNLCTGGHNFHGRYEYICVESMEKITELLLKIVEKYSK